MKRDKLLGLVGWAAGWILVAATWVVVAAVTGDLSAAVRELGPVVLGAAVLLVLITSPPATRAMARTVSRTVRRVRGRRATSAGTVEAHGATGATAAETFAGCETFAGMVRMLDDRELCSAWQQSQEVLGYTHRLDLRVELVALRQAYLDEMERRDPAGFAAWLGNGAGSDPGRFVGARRTRELD